MKILKTLHQIFISNIKVNKVIPFLVVIGTLIQLDALAGQPVHSLSAIERQKNQLEIQHELKDNKRKLNGTINFKKVSENVYTARYLGATSGLIIGDDGLLLIETKGPDERASKALIEAIRKISVKPIKYVLNTHSHFDHSGGNAYFARLGATIISQENYRYTPIAHHLRFDEKFTLTIGGEEVVAYHTPSHTLDSTIIHLPNSNVLFMGDNFSADSLLYEGANGEEGYHQVIDFALTLVDDKTVIVPGHGGLSQREDLIKNTKAKDALRKRIGFLFNQGFSTDKMSKDDEIKNIMSNYSTYYADMYKDKDKSVHLRTIQDLVDANFVDAFSISNALLNEYVGHYQMPNGNTTEIIVVDGKLFAREDGIFIAELKAISVTRFDLVSFPYTQNEQIEFSKNKSGKVDKLFISNPVDEHFVMNYWIKEGERKKLTSINLAFKN